MRDFAGKKGTVSKERATAPNYPYVGPGPFDTSRSWKPKTGMPKGPQRGHSSRTISRNSTDQFWGRGKLG